MVTALLALVVATACFALGGLNPASLIGRALGVDVAASGSGNPGATNAGRVLGRKWGLLVGVLDVLKGLVPTLVVQWALGTWVALLAGAALVLGHVYSPFLGGRGGKGVATATGAILAVAPWVGLIGVAAFVVVVPFVRLLGEASVVATSTILVLGVVGLAGVGPVADRRVGVWLGPRCGPLLWRHPRDPAASVARGGR